MNREKVQTLALEALIKNNGGTIVLSPGTGKSKVAIDFMKHVNAKRVLITSPRTNLIESWKEQLNEWYPRWEEEVSITMANVQTTYKWSEDIIAEFDVVIMDEIHTMATEEYGNIAVKARNVNTIRVGLTGTPDDKKAAKQAFYIFNCPIVYKYLDSAKDGIINKRKYIVYEHELNDDFKIEVKTKNKQWYSGELKQYQYIQSRIEDAENDIKDILGIPQDTEEYVNYFGWSKRWYWGKDPNITTEEKQAGGKYMRAISARTDLLWNLNSTRVIAGAVSNYITNELKSKVLVFSERTEQASKISEYTVHSKNEDKVNADTIAKFNSGDIKQIGSCYSLTLGLNLKDAKYAIMESFNGSDVQFKQRSGRVDRLPVTEDAIVIFIVVKDTQSETWFKQAVKFSDEDDVVYVNTYEQLIKKLNE